MKRLAIFSVALTLVALIGNVSGQPALVAHWPGDGNASDVVGGVDGSLVGNTDFVTGQVGDAFNFDGSGDYIDIDQDASILGVDPFSVTAWIRTSSSAEQVIVQQRSSNNFQGEWILAISWYHDNGNIFDAGKLCYWDYNAGQGLAFCSQQRVDDGEWHHV